MRLLGAARLFAASAVWRVLRLRPAGRVLVRGLGSGQEDLRTIAGMLLVRGGRQAIPLLGEALDQGHNLERTVRVIADVGAREFEPRIRALADGRDEEVAAAARDALELFALGSGSPHSDWPGQER